MRKIRFIIPKLLVGTVLIFPVTFAISSCSERGPKADRAKETGSSLKPGKLKKPSSSFTDTLIIDSRAAIFFKPDSIQLDRIEAVNQEMIFRSMQHECYYQMRYARLVLEKYWPQIRIIESSRARYFLFRKADKSEQIIDLDTKGDMCGLFLFDTKKNPELADMTNIDTDLGFYFDKQK